MTHQNQIKALEGSETLTMASREIAALTEKDHRNVVRDIHRMLEGLQVGPTGGSELSRQIPVANSNLRTPLAFLGDDDTPDAEARKGRELRLAQTTLLLGMLKAA